MITDWLSECRKQKGLTLTELANISGLSHSTISRIENRNTQLTLFSTVRLMYALDLSWTDLFTLGFIKPNLSIPEIYRPSQEDIDFPCFSFTDIDALDTSGVLNRGVAAAIVQRLLRFFIQKYAPKISDEKLDLLTSHFYVFIHSPASDDSLVRKYLPHLDLRYPQNFQAEVLRKIYLAGGVMTLLDLGRYVRYLRETKEISQFELAGLIELSHPVVGYFETKPGNKIKFNDLIRIDNALELNGELIIFAWRTAELYLGIHRIKTGTTRKIQPWQDFQISFIEKLITTSRLFQFYFPNDREWLDWYRQESLKGFENIVP